MEKFTTQRSSILGLGLGLALGLGGLGGELRVRVRFGVKVRVRARVRVSKLGELLHQRPVFLQYRYGRLWVKCGIAECGK